MRLQKILFIGLALAFSGYAVAQPPPGWNVTWGLGATSVPVMSPWAMALLAGLLSVAAFAFLRKRAHFGLMALAVAVLAGGLTTYSSERLSAGPVPARTFPLTTPSGNENLFCEMNSAAPQVSGPRADAIMEQTITIRNDNPDPTTITSVTPLNGQMGMAGASSKVLPADPCMGGVVLGATGQPDSTCTLVVSCMYYGPTPP